MKKDIKTQTMIYKTLYSKLKLEQHEPITHRERTKVNQKGK